ncbi:MAG: M48 family metallopeptidase [Marinobacter sp.]|uniref:M48 family metallopeptidase n=1 Tax=Marinobacter sp. TaxID=50741 RepID=UPI00299DAD81|nr:M48 family metallopeptidase [Marinobacter sp.]MDX1633633.1 M48 family metallopeptidase [Marinobacter sp.]
MAVQGFFDRQASARRNTGWLVLLFVTAVVLITLAVCGVGYLLTRSQTSHWSFDAWLLSQHGLVTAAVVVALIGVGSLVRWADLAGGGDRVARMVNARLLDPSSSDPDEQRLRNIVEEMAIASGVPVPQLYLMDQETGINAFVAGYTPNEAVMVVTHGALTQLSRDELQGVVGHEFSHILNGDMRLNVRLIALLAGILMIGQIGSFLLRSFRFRSSSSSRSSGRGHGLIVIAGLALLVIGYVGVFFGRLIQAAVSRQREMLADASSVQFTRNPEGIAGALYKIGLKGSYLDHTGHASDMNHMCIGESARMKFTQLLASHPPIEERINAIQPGMLARLKSRLRDTRPAEATNIRPDPVAGAAGFVTPLRETLRSVTAPLASQRHETTADAALSRHAGTVSEAGEAYAQNMLRQLPATFRSLLYTRAGAIQLCYALLVQGESEAVRQERLAMLPAQGPLALQRDLLAKLLPTLEGAEGALGFVALELAMPALRKLDPEEVEALQGHLKRLIAADGRLSLFEFALASFLARHLAPGSARPVQVRFRSYRGVEQNLACLFSLVARASSDEPAEVKRLYREAMAGFLGTRMDLQAPAKVTMRDLQQALARLNQLSPLLKPAVIDACGHCILADRKVSTREYDLIRLVADQLDCPLPPLTVAA